MENTAYYISKRAGLVTKLWEKVKALWDSNAGPFENIFSLVTNILPFIPGLGWGVWLLEKFASFLGYGMKDLGARLDREAELGPGSNIEKRHIDHVAGFMQQMHSSAINDLDDELLKEAGIFGGLMGMLGLKSRIAKIIFGLIKSLLLALGVNEVSDIYKKVEGVYDVAKPFVQGLSGPEGDDMSSMMGGLNEMAGAMGIDINDLT